MVQAPHRTDPRLFAAENIGRGLLVSIALEDAMFRIAGSAPTVGSWPAWRSTDDAWLNTLGRGIA